MEIRRKLTGAGGFSRGLRRGERGVVLIAALAAVIVVGALAAALFTTARAEMNQARTLRVRSELLPLAEAATVSAEQRLLQELANSLPLTEKDEVAIGPHVVGWALAEVGAEETKTDDVGIQTLHQRYQIDAVADVGGFRRTVHRLVDVGLTPIFQFAIFYGDDLELLPGPSMTLSGRVHANGDIYVGSGATLTIDSDYFRCTGDIWRKRKESGAASTGTVRIRIADTTDFASLYSESQLTGLGVPSTSGFDSAFLGYDANGDGDLSDAGDWPDFVVGVLDSFQGSVQTGAHGMKPIVPPAIGSIQRFESVGSGVGDYAWDAGLGDYAYVGAGNGDHRKGRYHKNANLVIRDLTAYDAAGTPLALPAGTITEQQMWDAREGQAVKVTQVDIALLNSSGFLPANGLLYASRSDASAANCAGVRLKNGSELAQALTVVSEDPVYVWGNYNSVDKKPAAVIADALNLLSKSWNDTKVSGSLPVASATTYNFAMIAGADSTVGAAYSGGFENLPRFHENWSGIACNFAGSFVKIFQSLIANGGWQYGGDRYTAPDRNYQYDTMFQNVTDLPPFTPNAAQVRSVGWWE